MFGRHNIELNHEINVLNGVQKTKPVYSLLNNHLLFCLDWLPHPTVMLRFFTYFAMYFSNASFIDPYGSPWRSSSSRSFMVVFSMHDLLLCPPPCLPLPTWAKLRFPLVFWVPTSNSIVGDPCRGCAPTPILLLRYATPPALPRSFATLPIMHNLGPRLCSYRHVHPRQHHDLLFVRFLFGLLWLFLVPSATC